MTFSKPIIIILILGLICGYFFIASALPIGIICVPVCLFFFKFSKEKLSSHINFFALISTTIGIIVLYEHWAYNFKTIIIYFFAIIILNLFGKIIKNKIPVPTQIISLAYWGLLVLSFLFLSSTHFTIPITLGKILKIISLFFSGTLGLPPSPLFIPTASICHENVLLFISTIMFSNIPAILINIIKEFKIKHIDKKFSAYFIISLIIGILLGKSVINISDIKTIDSILWQISIIIPSILLFGLNMYNSIKTLKKLKKEKKNDI